MKNIEDPRCKDEISPDFLHQVEYVRARILEKCEPKRGYAPGSFVNGIRKYTIIMMYQQQLVQVWLLVCFLYNYNAIPLPTELAGMLRMYVDDLNSPAKIPDVSSAWDQALKNTYQIATAKAIELYKLKMSSFSFPMEEGDLKRHHLQATEKAIECFQQLTQLDTDGAFSEHLTQLMVRIKYTVQKCC